MKKSKVILAIVLAVVLLITIISVPTFSWFSRPHSLSGEKMMLTSNNAYTGYNGNKITLTTKSSSTGVEGSYTTSVTDSGGLSGSGISYNKRNYFCTTISNGDSENDQRVSLYATKLSIPTGANGTLALGVNSPTRSYRDYTALATPNLTADRSMMRIYFEKDNSVSGWNGTEFYICWNESTDTANETLGNKGQNGTYTKLTHVGGSSNPNQYYADIPKTATHAFFCVENWGTNNNGSENWGQRSQELCNLASDGQTQMQSKLFKITSTTNSSNNHLVDTTSSGAPYSVTGACINHYYNSIFVATGNTFDADLSNTTNIPTVNGNSANYTGTLTYYSSNESVFQVYNDNNDGHIKGVIYPQGAGTATLYTKATGGSYPDIQQVETTVTVTSDANYVFYDVPIVRNVRIPKGESVDVYWYVINNSATTALRYTIDSLYVGM